MTGKYSFEIEGKSYSVWFGMAATEIFQKMSLDQISKQGEETLSSATLYATIVHAGLCNQADIDMVNRPSFKDSYVIAEELMLDEVLQKEIFDAWENSKPVKNMMDRLNKFNESAGDGVKKKETKAKTGTK